MAMHAIDLDRAEHNIFRNFVDKLWMGGNTDKLKWVVHITMYRIDKTEEDEEEAEGTVLGDGGEYASIVPVVYPCGTVSFLSLGSFCCCWFSYKPSHPSLTVILGARHIQEYFKKKRGRKRKCIEPQQEKASHEERMKQSMAIF